MYWKLADIYDKVKKRLVVINVKCAAEDCGHEDWAFEEIVSILLKFTLEVFSAWMTTDD